MKLDRTPTRRIRVLIHETENNKTIPGSCRSLALYETTSDEVLAIVRAALEAHVAKAALTEGGR